MRIELNRLRLAADNIERLINAAQEERDIEEINRNKRPRNYRHTHHIVYDSEGVEILIGDKVQFITRGLFTSTRGVIYKISGGGNRVTARDHLRKPISRAPHNVRVVLPEP